MSEAEAFVRQIQELERANIFAEQRLQQEVDRHHNTMQALNKGKKEYSALEMRFHEQGQELQKLTLALESANKQIESMRLEKEELDQHSRMLKDKYADEEEKLRQERAATVARLMQYTEQVTAYRGYYEKKPDVQDKRQLQEQIEETTKKLNQLTEEKAAADDVHSKERARLEEELTRAKSSKSGEAKPDDMEETQLKLQQQDAYIEWMLGILLSAASGQCVHCEKVQPLGPRLTEILEQERRDGADEEAVPMDTSEECEPEK